MSIVAFGGRTAGARRTLPGFPGIVEERTPAGPVYRVMAPYIARTFLSAEAARQARYELTGKFAAKEKTGIKVDPARAYVSRLGQKWKLAIGRLRINRLFDSEEEALAARDTALGREQSPSSSLSYEDSTLIDNSLPWARESW